MKKILTFLLAVLLLSLALCSCAKGNKIVLSDDGKYVDKKTGVVYIDAPACYEPIGMGEEQYGEVGSAQLYAVAGADPEQWLCDATGSVLYADSIELPTLDRMDISYASVLMEEAELVRITDAEVLGGIVDTYVQGQAIRKPTYFENTLAISWRIKLADEKLGLYYVLNYIELKEDHVITLDDGTQVNYGRAFIFNRFEDKCVVAGDALAKYSAEYKALNEAK